MTLQKREEKQGGCMNLWIRLLFGGGLWKYLAIICVHMNKNSQVSYFDGAKKLQLIRISRWAFIYRAENGAVSATSCLKVLTLHREGGMGGILFQIWPYVQSKYFLMTTFIAIYIYIYIYNIGSVAAQVKHKFFLTRNMFLIPFWSNSTSITILTSSSRLFCTIKNYSAKKKKKVWIEEWNRGGRAAPEPLSCGRLMREEPLVERELLEE